MSDPYPPLDPIMARNRYAALHLPHRDAPDPTVEAAARASLATAKIDSAVRKATQDMGPDAALSDAQAGHLVGLILMSCNIPGAAVLPIERMVRDAVVAAEGGEA